MNSSSPLNPNARETPAGNAASRDLFSVWRFLLRTVVSGLLVVYVGWNVYWWSHGLLAPSLCVAITGLPSPTTGGTRAIRALYAGQWRESLRYNAMTVPICLLLALTVGQIACQAMARRRLSLSAPLVWGWWLVLAVAWILKLSGDSQYW